MVEKKEGAQWNCKECGTLLTCHEKIYPETDTYKERKVMQWQNDDGSAHFSTKDGKTFTCNIPEGQQTQQQANNTLNECQQQAALTQGDPDQTNIGLATINEKLEQIISTQKLHEGILQSILHIAADLKIAQNHSEEDESS